MFQLDEQFLIDLGLAGMPDDQKQAFLQHIYEELEYRVGNSLSEGIDEMQMKEFEAFIAQDPEIVPQWLARHVPDFAQREDYQRLAASAPEGISALAIQSEYASLRWLEINRPDYREVVAKELEKLKAEIANSREVILGSGDAPAAPTA